MNPASEAPVNLITTGTVVRISEDIQTTIDNHELDDFTEQVREMLEMAGGEYKIEDVLVRNTSAGVPFIDAIVIAGFFWSPEDILVFIPDKIELKKLKFDPEELVI
jgi:hypothetical protein